MRPPLWLSSLALAGVFLTATPVRAQVERTLSEVERAYAEVDFEKTRTLARAALERGNNDRAATARLYMLWATSAAALDHAEEARDAFRHLLAADPELRLDKSLSPKIRAPYLEARGNLSMDRGKAPLEVTLQRKGVELELGLRDALQVARSIELSTRTLADEPFVRQRFEPRATRRLPAPHGRELEFFLQAFDHYGNVLFEHGSREDPRRLALGSSARTPLASGQRPQASRTPYYATAATLGTLGIASGVVATLMYVRREDAARQWNSVSCEQPGQTRGQQCGSVDERRRRAEYLTIGLSAASGAMLVGGLVTLLMTPSRSEPGASLEIEAAPRRVALSWRQAL